MQQFQGSDKEKCVPQGKSQPFCYGGKNVEQFPQHLDTSFLFFSPLIGVDVGKYYQ